MARTVMSIALVAAACASSLMGNMGCPETWVELKSSDKDGKECVFDAKKAEEGTNAEAVKTWYMKSETSKTWEECQKACTDAAEKASKADAPRYCLAASLLDVKDVKVKAKSKEGDKDAAEKTEKRGNCTHVIAGKGFKVDEKKWGDKDGVVLKDGNHCAAHTPGLTSAAEGFKAKDGGSTSKPREGEDGAKSFVGSSSLRTASPHVQQ